MKMEYYKVTPEIDRMLPGDLSSIQLTKLFSIIKEKALEYYFFKNVESTKWFFPLKEKSYFSPDKVPAPQKAKEGGYYIPEWNVLLYLERVSEQVKIPENEKYINELLEIIRNVTNHRDTEGKHIDNYHTWRYFVKILLNLPNDKITQDIIDLIPIWLDSKLDISLSGADIGIKLLPKFLNSDEPEDWEKAEKIIKFITAIKWIPKYTGEYKKKLLEEYKPILDKPEKDRTEVERIKLSFFNPKEKEPKTVLDTYWLFESLRKNADKIAEKCPNTIFHFADNLKQLFKEKLGPAHPTIEFGGNKYQMTIEQPSDFEYSIRIVLEKEVLEKELPWRSETTFELRDCGDKKTFVEGVKQGLLQRPDFKDLKDELDNKLANIYDFIPQDASFIWFRNLFSEPEFIHDTDKVLTVILRDIILAKAKRDKEFTGNKLFPEFFGPKYRYPIFRRIALSVIGKEWDTFKDYFWQLMETEEGKLLFSRDTFEPELYTLLETNISKFNNKEKEKIKAIIKKGPQRDYFNDRQINYWKQKWYSAVKTDSDFTDLYEEQKKTTKTEEELSFKEPEGFITVSGSEYSPLQTKDILTKSNKDLAVYLKNFKTGPRVKSPNLDALSRVLRESIKENPVKFVEDLTPFLELGYFLVHCILWGIRDAWNSKKDFNWRKLLDFIKQYITKEGFYENKFKIEDEHWNADYPWVTGTIGELIQEGTKDDKWAFEETHFETAKNILFLILEKQKISKSDEEMRKQRDAINYTLNSSPGKVITALIYLALHIARVEVKKGIQEEIKWTSDIKEGYENALQNKLIEAYILFGQYMTNLAYLDKEWVKEKINSISYSENKDLWEAFMEGYLWAGKLYEYDLMQQHFLVAIDYEFKEEPIEQRLAQCICIGYLRSNENFDESILFGKLLQKWKISQIEEIIKFFWSQYEYFVRNIAKKTDQIKVNTEEKQIAGKIINFWRWVYNHHYKTMKDEDINEDDKAILSNLCLLTEALPEIDSENFEWLKLSARYVETRFNSHFFIEYLDKLKDKECYVGEILLEMLKNYISYPHTKEPYIKSIVEHLYKRGKDKCRDSANAICNIYGENGYDFLRSLYKQYNLSA